MEIDSIANVLAVAIERHLTFYDASYTYLTEKENMHAPKRNGHAT